MAGDGRLVGLFDLGSNAFRLLCARVSADGAYEVESFVREQVRLGDGAFAAGGLPPEAIERAVEALLRMMADAREQGVGEFTAVATAAVREAANAAGFTAAVATACGLEVRVLSRREEAELLYRAARRRLDPGDRPLLALDVGGGSTQIAVGSGAAPAVVASLPLGALRLTAELSLLDAHDAVGDAGYLEMYERARAAVEPVAAAVREQHAAISCGAGGTVRSLDAVADAVVPPAQRAAGGLTHAELLIAGGVLTGATLAQRRRLPGLDPGRADTIVAGAAIVDAVMAACGVDRLEVPDLSLLRDGVLADYAEGVRRGG